MLLKPPTKNGVLDESLGMERTSGDAQLYKRIVKNFIKDYAGIITVLTEMDNSGDTEAIFRTAHTLKSTARTIGAEKLAGAAYEIETALLNGDASHLTGQIATLENALQELLTRLVPVASESEPEPEKSRALDVNEALALVAALNPLLAAGDTRSIDLVDTIRVTFSPLGKVCDDLVAQIEDYEFDAASEILLEIQSLLETRPG
jgi:HPt (histidine-containing phosphotransfer) domain-containing protein